jgi:hypothetical protein
VADAMVNNEKNGKYFRTVFGIDGKLISYNITVRQSALGDMDDYEFINGLEFVK